MHRIYLLLFVSLNLLLTGTSLACSADEGGSSTKTTGETVTVATPAGDGSSGSLTATVPGGVLLFDIGMHIEPLGAEVSTLAGAPADQPPRPGPDYSKGSLFERHVKDIRSVAAIVERYGGAMTVQTQTPFTTIAIERGETILQDLAASGHEIALHFHEDAHLGRDTGNLPAETWCQVMQEEIGYIRQASGVADIRYWSGGNLYPGLIDAAVCAGLDVNSDWKNPNEQKTVSELIGSEPWRPAGASSGNDVSRFAAHDPAGPVIFLPEGDYSRTDFGSMRRSEAAGDDEAYFEFLKQSLLASVARAQADPSRVHVFHFTIHPGEFRGSDPGHQFAVIEDFLAQVVDPLVKSGQVRWSTFSQMADAFQAWESANPGVAPRSET